MVIEKVDFFDVHDVVYHVTLVDEFPALFADGRIRRNKENLISNMPNSSDA
jgi:hypothetical protein